MPPAALPFAGLINSQRTTPHPIRILTVMRITANPVLDWKWLAWRRTV